MSGRQSGRSSALCTQLSQKARPEGIPRLDPEIPFGSLHLVSFSLVASTSLLFLPSGVHYAISDDVTKFKSLVGFEYVDGFALGCFTLKIQKLPQRQENSPRTYTVRPALMSAGWGRGPRRLVQQLQPMCCPFNPLLNLRLARLNAALTVILRIQSPAQRTTWDLKGKVNTGLMQTGMF